MKKQLTAKFAGMLLAGMVAIALVGCGTAPDNKITQYLSIDKVNGLSCENIDDPIDTARSLTKTSTEIGNFSTAKIEEYKVDNPDVAERKTELVSALDTKAAELESCATPTPEATPSATEEPNGTMETEGATAQVKNEAPIALSTELKALLDASSAPMIDCVAIVRDTNGSLVEDTYPLFVKALLEVDAKDANLRKWSDALSTPLKGASPDEMRTWLNRAICEEPIIGVSLAHLFANLEVQGVSILELQKTDWLKPFAVDASEIDNLVANYVPLEEWRLQNPGKTPTEEQYVESLTANHEYRSMASKVIFLLSRYQMAGVTTINSKHHYHLVAGGLRADGIPEVGISKEADNLPSLVFYLTEKTACKPISVLGFNTGDKRPMLGETPNSCEDLQPKPKPTVTPKPKPSTPPTTTPKPKPKPKPKPPVTCPPGQAPNDNGVCVKPKSNNKGDYKHDTGKPKAPAPKAPADKKPKPVETAKPGGGGVVDTPTNKPGSETGVTAPGKTPAPPVKPTPPPSNEGGSGSNTGDTGGF